MFDKFKSFLSSPVKAKVSNNFYASINEAKTSSKVVYEDKKDKDKYLLELSIEHLKDFMNNTDDDEAFNKALKGFENYIIFKPSQPEGYFYLAYIFYICDELEIAIKYLNTAKKISPYFEGLNLLQEDINNRISTKENIYSRYSN